MREASSLQEIIFDPVLAASELPLRRMFYPLGFPLELATNSRDVMEAASRIWKPFSQMFDEPAARFLLGVTDGGNEELPLPSFRGREHLMTIVGNAENFVTCDFRENLAFGWLTRAVAANPPFLRYYYLNGPPLMMAQQSRLAPIHAALVARGGCGVLLCGDSCAGKSTLSYACARAGWTFISDDGVFLDRKRADRYAIGDPHMMRFREDARSLFPELADRAAAARPNGKVGIEVFSAELPIQIAPGCSIDHVVFLDREHAGPTRLRPYSPETAIDLLSSHACFGSSRVRAEQRLCYQRLLAAGIWEMQYRDLDDAIHRLDRLAKSGG